MIRTKHGIRSALVAAAASALLSACGGGGSVAVGTDANPATGTLRVSLTDAPACGYDQVNITVDRVRVHQSASAGDNEAGWRELVLSPARKVDLLTLQNGVLAELGQMPLPAGQYQQIRLVLAGNGAGSPANSVVPTGASEMPMDTPSGMQSGLKLIGGFTVETGRLADIVLDFDACKSIVARGNGGYMLKPVMTMIPRSATGITGYVQAGVSGVTVSAQKAGVVVRSTQPNANGQFILAPIDPKLAPFDIVFTAAGRQTAVIAGVPAEQDKTTTVSTAGNVVTMPSSQTTAVSGTVDPAGARSTASVRALQTVGNSVEVAHVNADANAGTYALTLSQSAPRLMTYSAVPANPLPFADVGGSAGRFRLEAGATGYKTSTKDLTLSGSTMTGQSFTLQQ